LNGTVAGRCPGAVGVAGSGSWIVTAFTAGFGTVIGFLHLGQGPVRPANWSLTVKREPQLLQRTWIAMQYRGRRPVSSQGGRGTIGRIGSFRPVRPAVKPARVG